MKQNEKNGTMTPQEAIKALQADQELMLFDASTGEINTPDSLSDLNRSIYDANNAAIEALKKQIPMKVLQIQGVPVWGYCPECGQVVKQLHDHTGCSNCLQRLTWGESEVA